jgi:hypothetical protein
MAVAAWLRMLFLVNSIISSAISTSLILDSAADRFSAVAVKLLMVCSSLFCTEPRLDLSVETKPTAVSIVAIAASAASRLDTSIILVNPSVASSPVASPAIPKASAPSPLITSDASLPVATVFIVRTPSSPVTVTGLSSNAALMSASKASANAQYQLDLTTSI